MSSGSPYESDDFLLTLPFFVLTFFTEVLLSDEGGGVVSTAVNRFVFGELTFFLVGVAVFFAEAFLVAVGFLASVVFLAAVAPLEVVVFLVGACFAVACALATFFAFSFAAGFSTAFFAIVFDEAALDFPLGADAFPGAEAFLGASLVAGLAVEAAFFGAVFSADFFTEVFFAGAAPVVAI
jgi:hypothetical protein